MGHPRRAEAAPSPVQLLAIFSAKENGIPIAEISRRTKHSQSTIMRWWQQWGRDTAFYEAAGCEAPDLLKEYSFDTFYPDVEKQGTFDLAQAPSEGRMYAQIVVDEPGQPLDVPVVAPPVDRDE